MIQGSLGIWDGITEERILGKRNTRQRLEVFEAAKKGHWAKVLDLIEHLPRAIVQSPNLTNLFKIVPGCLCGASDMVHVIGPEDSSFNTLLHYAVLTNADPEIIGNLIQKGASRLRRNAKNQTPLDLAKEQNQEHLYDLLQPTVKQNIPLETLYNIEQHFHQIMTENWTGKLLEQYFPQMPQVDTLLESPHAFMYFPIEGMCGGYTYWLEQEESEVILYTYNDHCFCSGCEELHRITTLGGKLIAEGEEADKHYPAGVWSFTVRENDLSLSEFINEDM